MLEVFFSSIVNGTPLIPAPRNPTKARSPRSADPFLSWREMNGFSSASTRYSACRISNAATARFAELRLRLWTRLSVAIVAPLARRCLRPGRLAVVADEVLDHAHGVLGRHVLGRRRRGRLLGLLCHAGVDRFHELQDLVVLIDNDPLL